MTAVQSTGDIWWRKGNNEFSIDIIPAGLRTEVSALLPPCVPGRLDRSGVVGREMWAVERLDLLLLPRRGRVLEGRECLDDFLFLGLRLCLRLIRVLLLLLFLQLRLLRSELGSLFRLGLFLRLYTRKEKRTLARTPDHQENHRGVKGGGKDNRFK